MEFMAVAPLVNGLAISFKFALQAMRSGVSIGQGKGEMGMRICL